MSTTGYSNIGLAWYQWLSPVTTATALPSSASNGDVRVALDTGDIWVYNSGSSMWVTNSGGGGSGTVTSVAVASSQGFTGTVANPTTTAVITIGTSVTGILYGNGTSVAAAVAANFPTLNQNTTGNAGTVTNGLYSSGSYSNPSWLTSILGSIVSGNISGNAANITGNLPTTQLSGYLQAAQEPAHTGDVTNSAGSLALSLVATTNATLQTLSALSLPGIQLSGNTSFTNIPDPITGGSLLEDFLGEGSPYLLVAANSGSIHYSTTAYAGHPGVAMLSTGSSSTSFPAITSVYAPFVLGSGALYFEADIYVSAVSTSSQTYTLALGFSDNSTGSVTPSNSCMATYTNGVNSGNWVLYTSNGVIATSTNASVGPSASTWYKVGILINASGTSVSLLINRSVVATSTSNLPASSNPFGYQCGIFKSVGTSAVTLVVDYIWVYNILSTPR